MYSRQEASLIKKKFWTSFGQYMKPVISASGDTVNWLNYKTGIKHLYFRMDVDNKQVAIAIELRHPDKEVQNEYIQRLQQVRKILEQTIGEQWDWQLDYTDEDGNKLSRIGIRQQHVNVFNTADWPLIISFLKPRIIALDVFWDMVKEGFE